MYFKQRRTKSVKGGKLIFWTLTDLCDTIDKMQENDYDCIMFIDGYRGIGKSTLAYKVGGKVKSSFSPRRDLCYSREQVIKSLANKNKGFIFADEMINVAYNRDFYEKDQKVLLKGLNMYRDSCNIFIGCIPRFADLDIQIQKLCKIRLTVIRRGLALLHKQIPSIYTSDPWDMKNNQKIEESWRGKGIVKPKYSQLTTVIGILKFGDLSPSSKKLYRSIKQEKRNQVYADYDEGREELSPEKKVYTNLIRLAKEGHLTVEQFNKFCAIRGDKVHTIRTRINRILKEEGEGKVFSNFLVKKKANEIKDKPKGFNI